MICIYTQFQENHSSDRHAARSSRDVRPVRGAIPRNRALLLTPRAAVSKPGMPTPRAYSRIRDSVAAFRIGLLPNPHQSALYSISDSIVFRIGQTPAPYRTALHSVSVGHSFRIGRHCIPHRSDTRSVLDDSAFRIGLPPAPHQPTLHSVSDRLLLRIGQHCIPYRSDTRSALDAPAFRIGLPPAPHQPVLYSVLDGIEIRVGRSFMPIQIDLRKFVTRHAHIQIRTALTDTRIVAIVGPRQSGKTTLAQRVASDRDLPFVTFDDLHSRQFAETDPVGFIRGYRRAVIDEIQRVPSLILDLKKTVDEDPRPGRYLITGSVEFFKSSLSPDSLAGRVETIELLPFSQSEIEGANQPTFLDRAFSTDFPSFKTTGPTVDLVERVISGGFPLALSRAIPSRRQTWLRSYVNTLAQRDIPETVAVNKLDAMSRLIDRAALFSGQLINLSNLGRQLGVDAKTIDRWLTLLEHMFLLRRIRAWHTNQLKRLVKTPKLQFLDSGLLAVVRKVNAQAIARDRQKLGPLLECFVYSELAKAAALIDEDIAVSHYRDKDQAEVDLVLERSADEVVGIEVKARATVHPKDFRGLRRLKAAMGARFSCGIILHDGERIQQLGPKLFAMPVSVLWEA